MPVGQSVSIQVQGQIPAGVSNAPYSANTTVAGNDDLCGLLSDSTTYGFQTSGSPQMDTDKFVDKSYIRQLGTITYSLWTRNIGD